MTTRRYRVTVDGETYDVEIEELGGAAEADHPGTERAAAPPHPGPVAPPPRAAMAPAPGSAAAPPGKTPAPVETSPKKQAEATPGRGERIEAPLPGTVLNVNVKPGQAVSSGDVLVVLEAMKMQNEIVSPRDGTVTEVAVKKGETVALGDLLVRVD